MKQKDTLSIGYVEDFGGCKTIMQILLSLQFGGNGGRDRIISPTLVPYI